MFRRVACVETEKHQRHATQSAPLWNSARRLLVKHALPGCLASACREAAACCEARECCERQSPSLVLSIHVGSSSGCGGSAKAAPYRLQAQFSVLVACHVLSCQGYLLAGVTGSATKSIFKCLEHIVGHVCDSRRGQENGSIPRLDDCSHAGFATHLAGTSCNAHAFVQVYQHKICKDCVNMVGRFRTGVEPVIPSKVAAWTT